MLPSNSSGCSTGLTMPEYWPSSSLTPGSSTNFNLPSQRRPFRLTIPYDYDVNSPPPLLLHFHGWGGTLAAGAAFHAHGLTNGYVVASPLGFDDDGTQPTSWNGAGTVGSPGPLGMTCHEPPGAGFGDMCYRRSCGTCNDTWCAHFPRRDDLPRRCDLPLAHKLTRGSLLTRASLPRSCP